MSDSPKQDFEPAPILTSARRHPVITGILLGFATVGAVLGVAFLSDDWSLARRLAAGDIAGAGCGLMLTAYRIIG